MHTQRINLILHHDPVEFTSVLLPEPNGATAMRYSTVECRQALEQLNRYLREWCNFVMREKFCYIKLIEPEGFL